MAILTALVIATLIVAGAYVGYHAWDKSLHEEKPEKHSEPIEFETFQAEPALIDYPLRPDLKSLIS